MGLIHDLLFKRKVKKLEDEIAANPQPELFTALYEVFRADGKMEEANRVIHRGATLFPDSELKATEEEVKLLELRLDRERLEEKIRNYPNPILFAKLAEIYLKLEEPEKSLKVCQRGIQNFPKYGGTYLVIADVCLSKGDVEGAIENFERALSLDRYNYTALRKLAKLHGDNGDFPRTVKALEDILYFAPEDKAVQEELKLAKKQLLPNHGRATTQTLIRKDALKDPVKLSDLEKPTATLNVASATPSSPLAKLREVPGVKSSIIVDKNGLVVDGDLKPGSDEELTAALLTTVFRTTTGYSEQLGIGEFDEGIIFCEKEDLYLLCAGELVIGVWADSSVKKGLLEMKIHDVLEYFLETR